ncbi:hypothetical protein C4565_02600 [Candidatus Parcubacteria bacterium]|nr:MAG: hypothetical protein C4565_02600 [Candidatus Parcubacteria bacterium]
MLRQLISANNAAKFQTADRLVSESFFNKQHLPFRHEDNACIIGIGWVRFPRDGWRASNTDMCRKIGDYDVHRKISQ